jgi:hypothetical protein
VSSQNDERLLTAARRGAPFTPAAVAPANRSRASRQRRMHDVDSRIRRVGIE